MRNRPRLWPPHRPWVVTAGLVGLLMVAGAVAAYRLTGGPPAYVPPAGPAPPPRALPTAIPPTSLSPELVPAHGALFGAYTDPGDGTHEQGLELLEARLGRRLDIDRAYYAWDDPIPTGQEVTDVAMGRITLLSWKAQERDGRALSWSGIASGAQDRWIVARARAFKAFAHPVMLAFHHEPENDVATNGTPEEFAAAFRHVHDVFVREGAVNVVWVVVLFAFTYSGPRVAEFYPGDGFVDWVGGDGFNFYGTFAGPGGCSRATWRPFSEIFSAMVAFARARGKPAVAAEWASAVDPQRPARKAAWLREAHATITSWPTLKAVVTFDADRRDSSGCDWRPSTSAEAWDAFKSMAIDPALDVLEARASP